MNCRKDSVAMHDNGLDGNLGQGRSVQHQDTGTRNATVVAISPNRTMLAASSGKAVQLRSHERERRELLLLQQNLHLCACK